MAPRGTKRAAQASKAERKPEKKPRMSPEEERLERVIVAIHGLEQLPFAARELLVMLAKDSLTFAKDERHRCQDKVVAMIEEALTDMRAAKAAAVESEAEKVQAAEASMASLQAAAEAAKAELAGKSEAVKAAEEEAARAEASAAEAAAAHEAQEQQLGLAQQTQATKQEESRAFDAAIAEHFDALLNGSWEEAEQAQQHMDALAPFTAQLQLDESLRTSLPSACMKRMNARGSFDCLVLQQAHQSFTDKAAELRTAFAACAPAVEQAAAAAETTKQALAAAQATASGLAAALAEAKGEESQSAAASEAAAKEVESFSAELQQVTRGHSLALAELELVQGPLADFEALRDGAPVVAEAAPEPAAAEVVEATVEPSAAAEVAEAAAEPPAAAKVVDAAAELSAEAAARGAALCGA